MRNLRASILLASSLSAFVLPIASGAATAARDGDKVKMQDDCDPSDPAWNNTGGCRLESGTVTDAEFAVFSVNTTGSPLVGSVIGHPAWRNDPGYLVLPAGESLKILNTGGRNHTFTEVAQFGGGVVGVLNSGLAFAPQCAGLRIIPAGGRADIANLTPGLHKFQCCLHPWMRTVVSVE